MKDSLVRSNHPNVNFWVFITIVLCGFILYLGPLQNAFFCLDDFTAVKDNEIIKQINIPNIFDAFNTRFLVGLSFALNYSWCALNASGYRLINLLIHCFNAFLVYLLIKSTLRVFLNGKPMGFRHIEWPAFFGALVFLVHPIQTEPVNYITQRFVLMGVFFYLLSLYFYVQYRCMGQKRYITASLLAAAAAMFCKEFVITLPVMIVLYEFYFLNGLNEKLWKRLKRILPFFFIILIVPLVLLRTTSHTILVARIADSDTAQQSNMQKLDNHVDITKARHSISRKQYFLTELNVMCTYLRLLVLPINQNFDYDYPISNNINTKTMLSGLGLLCLLAVAVMTYPSYRIASFSILWFFIALSVESSFIPIGHVIA